VPVCAICHIVDCVIFVGIVLVIHIALSACRHHHQNGSHDHSKQHCFSVFHHSISFSAVLVFVLVHRILNNRCIHAECFFGGSYLIFDVLPVVYGKSSRIYADG